MKILLTPIFLGLSLVQFSCGGQYHQQNSTLQSLQQRTWEVMHFADGDNNINEVSADDKGNGKLSLKLCSFKPRHPTERECRNLVQDYGFSEQERKNFIECVILNLKDTGISAQKLELIRKNLFGINNPVLFHDKRLPGNPSADSNDPLQRLIRVIENVKKSGFHGQENKECKFIAQ